MIDTAELSAPNALALPAALRCPICGNALTVDFCWVSPHWICAEGHTYSNISVLVAELDERGWLPGHTGGNRRKRHEPMRAPYLPERRKSMQAHRA